MGRSRKNWTPQEDMSLRMAIHAAVSQSRPLLWRELAKSVPGRSNKDCRRRWWNSLAEGTTKGSWSEEEDARLIEAVQSHGYSWTQVALAVGTRTADQCSSHWSQVLDPNINHSDWTPTEDSQLLHEVLSHGTNWATISASHKPRRTTLALKNRYSALRVYKPNQDKGSKERRKSKGSSQLPTPPPNAILPSPNPPRQDDTDFAADQIMGLWEEEDNEDDTESDSSSHEDEPEEGMISPVRSAPTLADPISRRAFMHANNHLDDTDVGKSRLTNTTLAANPLIHMPTSCAKDWITELPDQYPLCTPLGQFSPNYQVPQACEGYPKDYLGNGTNVISYIPHYSHPVDPISIDCTTKMTNIPDLGIMSHPAVLSPKSHSAVSTIPMPLANIEPSSSGHAGTPTREGSRVMYQVSMDIVCDRAQIDGMLGIMGSLEGLGASVSIKIDRKGEGN